MTDYTSKAWYLRSPGNHVTAPLKEAYRECVQWLSKATSEQTVAFNAFVRVI